MIDALETSASEGAVVLEAEGVLFDGRGTQPLKLQFDGENYVNANHSFSRQELTDRVKNGHAVVTFTGRHGERDDIGDPQPGLWTRSPLHSQSGRQVFPILHKERKTMEINGRHVRQDANIVVDGRRVKGTITFPRLGKSSERSENSERNERVSISLAELPESGMHFLQVQNQNGLFSNDFIFFVVETAAEASALRNRQNPAAARRRLSAAIQAGDLKSTRMMLKAGVKLNGKGSEEGMTPLATAAFHGQLEIAKYLIEQGAAVNGRNNDGNTPLILAAFTCRDEMCRLLLSHGASISQRNRRNETAIDVVSGEWNQGLASFYRGMIRNSKLDLKVEEMKSGRIRIKELLEMHRQQNAKRDKKAASSD